MKKLRSPEGTHTSTELFLQALAALFLMNNVHYIVKAVESSEALSVVGQDWIERHKDLIEQYGEEYQASHMTCTPAGGRSCMEVAAPWSNLHNLS